MKNQLINSSEECTMNRRYALWSTNAKLGVVALIAALIGFGSVVLQAQGTNKPELPTLTLTGDGTSWNRNVYPDGRIWSSSRGPNGERTLLVPVYIKNCWVTRPGYKTFPIYSFKFKVQFDSTALELIGIEKNGPLRGPQMTPVSCLAKDFEFTVDVARDTSYQSVINAPAENRRRGKRAMITAISSKELPQTLPASGDVTAPCDQRPFLELVYLRFRVIANPAIDPVSARTPLIITNDTLYYNDFAVGKELPFQGDPAPGQFAGLGGIDNYFVDALGQEQIRDPLRPSRPGMIWLEVTDVAPRLSFTNVANPAFRLADSVNGSNGSQWYIVDPITIDYGTPYDDQANGIGTRDVDVINAVTGSRAYDIMVQSDSKWLKFKSFTKGGGGQTELNPFPNPVREGYIPFMDKGILGSTVGVDPQGNATTGQRDLNLRIICDPGELPAGDAQEVTGTYVGYLTFKSNSLDVAPVRLKVTFIYFRTPYEPNAFDENENWKRSQEFLGRGITLQVRNSNTPNDVTYVTFGVGNRATDGCDTLFGETIYANDINPTQFAARWYPKLRDGSLLIPNGLGDLWAATPQRNRSTSRDIRSIYSDTTLIYTCRFSAGGDVNYPIVVAWNTDEFSEGSELFIRDTLNGSRFNVNMRAGTVLGGTRQSYTIRDADIKPFVIEYTLPKVARFPVINKGWNLLSVPVNPSSSYWKDIFKNALNIPVRFSQNTYQTNETNLNPGVGYFVKYSDETDKTIAGSRIRLIDDQSFATRLFEGWNTIGSLSFPTSIENLSVLPYGTGALPSRIGDVYGYVTNRGYQAVTEIEPGLGYWIKVAGSAYLRLSLSAKASINSMAVREAVQSNSTRVTIADASNNQADVFVASKGIVDNKAMFELPPVPPHNIFDVRFTSQTSVEDEANPTIQLQGVTFPVSVTINNPATTYAVVNPISGAVIGTAVAGRPNVITIADARTPYIRLMGEEAQAGALNVSVSPNPVTANATVSVVVPSTGAVTVTVFDAVGSAVATLVNGDVLSAGVHNVELNGASLSAGRYIVKATVNGVSTTSTVSVVR